MTRLTQQDIRLQSLTQKARGSAWVNQVVRMAREMVPAAAIAEVPDAGHSVYFERPEVFNRVVHDFLKNAGWA